MPSVSGLTLNANAVDVADGTWDEEREEIGSSGRSPTGRWRLTRQALRKLWKGTTPPLSPTTWKAVVGTLLGQGDKWDFRGLDVIGTNANFSAKGIGSTSYALPVYPVALGAKFNPYFFSGDDADGNPSGWPEEENGGLTVPKAGPFAAGLDGLVTNEFPANVRTGTKTSSATTGFTAQAGATLTSDTVKYKAKLSAKARSLKVVTAAGAGSGFSAASSTLTGTGTRTASFYLIADSGTPGVQFYLRDDGLGTNGSVGSATLSATRWKRCYVAHTGQNGNTSSLYVTNGLGGAITFFADLLQLEKASFPSAWVDGSRTNAQAGGNLSDAFGEEADLYVGGWTSAPRDPTAGGRLLQVKTGDPEAPWYVYLRCTSGGFGSGRLTVDVVDDAGSTVASFDGGSATWYSDAWKHAALVVRRAPESGEHNYELFINGALAGYADAALPPGAMNNLKFNAGPADAFPTAVPWNAYVDDWVVLPYAPPAAWILNWTAAYCGDVPTSGRKVFPRPPRVAVGGFLVNGRSSNFRDRFAFAKSVRVQPVQVEVGGLVIPDYARVSFELAEEVG